MMVTLILSSISSNRWVIQVFLMVLVAMIMATEKESQDKNLFVEALAVRI
jgi:hypothetical protein